jgi:hypothetical protein
MRFSRNSSLTRLLREEHPEVDRRQEGFDQQIGVHMRRHFPAVSGATYRGDDPAPRVEPAPTTTTPPACDN